MNWEDFSKSVPSANAMTYRAETKHVHMVCKMESFENNKISILMT